MKFIFTLFLASTLTFIFSQIAPPTLDFSSCNFQAIAHRGYSSVYPENSLLAIEEAFKRGIKICEVDIQVSSDDVYVLFHDSFALHRTSNGQGNIDSTSFNALNSLDFGSWKGEHFRNTKIPTLEDALLLAQKYNAQLYLDTKTLRIDLLLAALDATGVDNNRLMPSLFDSTDISNFTEQLPNTPWVWFNGGLFPDDIESFSFYKSLVEKNCVAFEVTEFRVNSSEWDIFEQNVHAAGAKTWVFTENNNDSSIFNSMRKVDAIESDRPWEISDFICNGIERIYPDSVTRGNWRFNNGLNNVIGQGSQLRTVNYNNPNPLFQPLFGTCSQFGISALSTENDSVMFVPKQGFEGGLFVYSNSFIESYGIEDESYSIVMDVLFPESSLGNWISIFQTNTLNLNDAELFINPQNQIGISDLYFGTIEADTWYRIAITVNITGGFMKLYIDGEKQGEIPIENNRWAVINSAAAGERQGFLLFTDDNDETEALFMSSLQYRDYELDAQTISKLGGANSNGIKTGNADLWNINFPNRNIEYDILDYDNYTHHIWLNDTDIGEELIEFETSKNANATPISASVLDWSSGTQNITVISEDESQIKNWQIVLHKNTVGISEEKLAFKLYPNPAKNKLDIQLKSNQKGEFNIISIDGQVLTSGNIQSVNTTVNIEKLKVGTYILQLKLGDKKSSKMFVKN